MSSGRSSSAHARLARKNARGNNGIKDSMRLGAARKRTVAGAVAPPAWQRENDDFVMDAVYAVR